MSVGLTVIIYAITNSSIISQKINLTLKISSKLISKFFMKNQPGPKLTKTWLWCEIKHTVPVIKE